MFESGYVNTGVSVTWVQTVLFPYTQWKWRLTPSRGTSPASAFTFTGEHISNALRASWTMLIHAGTQWMVNGHGVDLVVKWLDDSLWGGGNAEGSGAGGEFHISPTILLCCPSSTDNTKYWWTSNTTASQHQNKEAKRPILTKYRVYIQSIHCSAYFWYIQEISNKWKSLQKHWIFPQTQIGRPF